MCGILGIVGTPRAEALDTVELLRHRGPDGEGRWVGGRAGLAMRRLAIIDLETGDQPVSNERVRTLHRASFPFHATAALAGLGWGFSRWWPESVVVDVGATPGRSTTLSVVWYDRF